MCNTVLEFSLVKVIFKLYLVDVIAANVQKSAVTVHYAIYKSSVILISDSIGMRRSHLGRAIIIKPTHNEIYHFLSNCYGAYPVGNSIF